jgi:hypothetical protein
MRIRAFLAALLLSASPALAQTTVVGTGGMPLSGAGATSAAAQAILTAAGTAALTVGGNLTFGGATYTAGCTALGTTVTTGAVTCSNSLAPLANPTFTGSFTATGLVTNADLAGSIAASKLVGTDIATVGTITAGRWSSSGVLDTTSLAIGPGALNAQTGAGPYYNTASGFQTLYSNTTGTQNTASGVNALVNNTTGTQNTASGVSALFDNGAAQTAGAFNVGTSYTILTIGTTDFTLIGASSNTVGVVFTASGVGAGTGTATPNTNSNTALGYNAGRGIAYGSNNTILGANVTGFAAGLSDAIILATGEGTIRADFGKTTAGAWTILGATTITGQLFLPGLTSGSGTSALCLNATGSQIETDTNTTVCGFSAAYTKDITGEVTTARADAGLTRLAALDRARLGSAGVPVWHFKSKKYGDPKVTHVGLVADDVATMDPRCGIYEHGKLKNYEDRCVLAYLTATVAAQQAEIAELKAKVH